MIIEIESVYGDSLLHGKRMTLAEIRKLTISVFCIKTGCEEFEYQEDIQVDYVTDLDTHIVYKPRWQF